jgi:hypothetical protein
MPTDGETERGRPIRAEAHARLVVVIARARGWVAELSADP